MRCGVAIRILPSAWCRVGPGSEQGGVAMDMQQMLEEYAVRNVRQQWAFARDHCEWETMRACFHPDATVRVLWYSGPVAGFLGETIESFVGRKPGEGTKH